MRMLAKICKTTEGQSEVAAEKDLLSTLKWALDQAKDYVNINVFWNLCENFLVLIQLTYRNLWP